MKPGVANHDLFQLKSITQPTVIGNRYFFVENRIDEASNQYRSAIVSVDEDQNKSVWADDGINVDPIVCGNQLFYLHQDADKHFQIMAMPLTGGTAKQITHGDNIQQIKKSNDEQTLVLKLAKSRVKAKYATTDFPVPRHVTKIFNRLDGTGWLPNDLSYQLVYFDVHTHETITLMDTKDDFDIKTISADNTKIVYTKANHPELKTDFDPTQGVYLYDVDTKQETYITASVDGGIFSDAQFAPDGKHLALTGNTNEHPNCTVNNFWLYSFADAKLTNVTQPDDQYDCGSELNLVADFVQQRRAKAIQWFDNDHYVVHAYHHGRSVLLTGTAGNYHVLYDEPVEIYDFSVIDDHQIVMSVSNPQLPSELRVLTINGEQVDATTIFNPNASYERDHEYAKVDHFTYEAADQTVQLDGWTVHANHLAAGQKSPVILYIHGGPHAAYGETFFHEFQTLANHGYAVVFVNPRGSTTYGQAFQSDVIGHYGEHDFSDVLTGLDHALNRYADLDATKLFVAGGSYGGFLSSWILGHSDRFTAASVQRPVTDWQALYGTSDIGFWFNRTELGLDLFEDPDAPKVYWDKSPLKYAHNIKTPVRIQHGEYDMRCPTNQSEALFTAVKQTGTDCDYIRYPQSFHGFSRNGLPNLRIQRIADLLEWFNRYKNDAANA
ncbi:S9 family peptidase [Nicoliella spurrieriana]|uniref:S9 family peptidase n=1 Tax=Nicoliella spurrieriana TaxID=2925830 RepID=A0A976RR41_9LACO|nr:S9 family peptidase [Nicoliella spurrieriana]UQS86244.1 S9 family peptidase [Nicoliella spurrieriana]